MTQTTMPTVVTLPETGTYVVDPVHSSIEFVARHLVGAKVRGRFAAFSGTITIADVIENSSVHAEVEAASISTGQDQRDDHVRSADFLDAANFPTFTLQSTGLSRRDDANWVLETELTVRGVTKPVTFDLEYLGTGPGMAPDSVVAAFDARADLDRRDFGVSFSAALGTGNRVVGNKITLELSIEAHKQ